MAEEPYIYIVREVIRALARMVAGARGTCVTFTLKQVAKRAGLVPKPMNLVLVKYIITRLCEEGLVGVYSVKNSGRRGARVRYIITRNSPFWRAVKSGNLDVCSLADRIAG